MDKEWDKTITNGVDVNDSSMVFRYNIGRSMLYRRFVYNHHRMLPISLGKSLTSLSH